MTENVDLAATLRKVNGVGDAIAEAVTALYPSAQALAAASVTDLTKLDGVGAATARKLLHAVGVASQREAAEIEALRHQDKRLNIPTDQQVHLTGTANVKALYPRDTELDPQLVWTGKDELDELDLAVPVVPIYIQEKIVPQAIIENLRATALDESDEPEATLFDDFDGLSDPLDAIEFYEHPANWSNRMILGDSLVAMTSLAEKESLKGRVQTIYFDPPYGVSYKSNWQPTTSSRDVADGRERDLVRQPEQIQAFRDTWRHGVHSYLTYLRDRLQAAHGLLAESGSIFVQISDDNVHVVRNLLDEVYGPDNFVSQITFQKTTSAKANLLPTVADFILWYAKDKPQMKYRKLFRQTELGGPGSSGYTSLLLPDGTTRPLSAGEKAGFEPLPANSRAFYADNLTNTSPGSRYPVEFDGETYTSGANYWRTGREGMARLIAAGRVAATSTGSLGYIRYLDDFGMFELNSVWTDTVGQNQFGGTKMFAVMTPLRAIERCVQMTSDPGDLVLDPTCGSGSTALVAEKWGRRWITIDTSRVALVLSRQRLMGAAFPYYQLVDTPAGALAEATQRGVAATEPESGWGSDIRRGFAYRRAIHVMQSTVTNCEDITQGISQREAEAAIRRSAESEVLYDQPVENPNVIRVAGPFTVESLSPHRTLNPDATVDEPVDSADLHSGGFAGVVITNLSKSGVQNGFEGERLSIDWLDPHPGTWVHGVGGFTDADGQARTVAISVGPENGTVGREQVAEASKEAIRDVRADLLLICAYAFDAGAGEQATIETDSAQTFTLDAERAVGQLRVLNVRVNADLMMNDDLKNTGAGNLFMVFGEPDIAVERNEDETLTVRLDGLDIYDPNKGTIRSASTAEVACWFIDTSYDGESFFARHAYFTGGGKWDPYESLKAALRSEINPEAWNALYTNVSLPFVAPESGKIAVKAINHFGDEAMKVFSIGD